MCDIKINFVEETHCEVSCLLKLREVRYAVNVIKHFKCFASSYPYFSLFKTVKFNRNGG